MGRETWRTGGKILTDIAERSPTDTMTAGDILAKHVNESAQNFISKLRGRGRKRTHGEAVEGKKKNGPKPKKFKRAPRKIIRRDIFYWFHFSHSSAAYYPYRRRGDSASQQRV